MGNILVNARIFRDPFLIRTLSIRVNREVQDIYVFIRGAQAKNHVGPIKGPLTPVSFFSSVPSHVKAVWSSNRKSSA